MLKFRFNPHLNFQLEAIQSVIDVFKGQEIQNQDNLSEAANDELILTYDEILRNVNGVRKRNDLEPRNNLEFPKNEDLNDALNLTIEMETGTGKTYVYLRTTLELYQNYGFSKFIIVVPSIAIKEGVLKTLKITKNHFHELYNKVHYSYFNYSSKKIERIRVFTRGLDVQIMILTRDAFNKRDINLIYSDNDRLGDKPINLIQSTRPIVILDEPQKMAGTSSRWGISELNPLFILRYSATHKHEYNLIYKLNPFEAYSLGLVKKIEVSSISDSQDLASKKIVLSSIKHSKTGKVSAKVKLFVKRNSNIRLKFKTISMDSDLEEISNNPYYHGFKVSEISEAEKFVYFTNGVKILEESSELRNENTFRQMVRETIKEHLYKKSLLNPKGIKVLSLFFINRVADYLPHNGWLRIMFEKEMEAIISSSYPDYADFPINRCHDGYFSTKKTYRGKERDKKAYNLIMRDKERLLSLDEPVEFIFSHSALREGWDNPNVFNICTLAYSFSDIKKRQEIGRGMRLPVDQRGTRITDDSINILTVITNETYADFVSQIQTEYIDELDEESPPIRNRAERKTLKRQEDKITADLFTSLWNLISQKKRAIFSINSDELIELVLQHINSIKFQQKEPERMRKDDITFDYILNLANDIEDNTKLSRNTIFKIFRNIKNPRILLTLSQYHSDQLISILNSVKHELIIKDLDFMNLNEGYSINQFEKIIHTDSRKVSILQNNKTLYYSEETGKSAIFLENGSPLDRELALWFDLNPQILFFFPFPDWFRIHTPFGFYHPDWAIFTEESESNKKIQRYYVLDTKNSTKSNSFQKSETKKTLFAEKYFNSLKQVQFMGPIHKKEDLTF